MLVLNAEEMQQGIFRPANRASDPAASSRAVLRKTRHEWLVDQARPATSTTQFGYGFVRRPFASSWERDRD